MNKLLKYGLICSPFVQYLFLKSRVRTTQAVLSIAFEIAVILWFFYNFEIKRKPDLRAAMLFWGWACLSSVWIFGKDLMLRQGMSSVIVSFLHLSLFFLFYTILACSLTMEAYRKVTKVLVYPALIVATICIWEKFGIIQFKFDQTWISGPLGNGTDSAMYMAVLIPFVFQQRRYYIPLVMILSAIVITTSASALIGALIVSLLMMVFLRKYISLTISLIGLGAGIVLYWPKIPTFLHAFGKLEVWNVAVHFWKKSPWFGYGLDAFKNLKVYDKVTCNYWYSLHNHYLWIMYSLGVIGFILFLNFIRPMAVNFFKNRRELLYPAMSLLAVAIMASVSVPIRVYPIVLITAINMAVLTKGTDYDTKRDSREIQGAEHGVS